MMHDQPNNSTYTKEGTRYFHRSNLVLRIFTWKQRSLWCCCHASATVNIHFNL